MAPRAAASALRSLAAACRASPAFSSVGRTSTAHTLTRVAATAAAATATRASPAFSSVARSTASRTLTRVAATASAPPRAARILAANHASFPSAATPAATRSSAAARISITGTRPFSTFVARSRSASRYKVTRHPFKIQRRFKHQRAKTSIPDEVQSEIHRIESEGLQRHKHLQMSIQLLTKQVADSTAAAKRLKVESTWTMGKMAFGICSAVLAGAAASGYIVLNFVKSGWRKAHMDSAEAMLEVELKNVKDDLDSRMDRKLEEMERKDAAVSDEKNRALDEREAAVAAREAAVAAKEAAASAKKD